MTKIKLIKGTMAVLMIVFLGIGFALAQGNYPAKMKEGQTYKSFFVDLNKDGHKEKIAVKVYGVSGYEWFAQIVVFDSSGKVIWKGPADKNRANPLVFGNFDYGSALPEVVRDMDDDGSVEMIATTPVSDVRPQPFRLFRWNGKKFVYVFIKTLMEKPAGSGVFVWSKPGPPEGCWITELREIKEYKNFIAEVFEYKKEKTRGGSAEVASSAAGFKVVKWIKPLKSF
ncbi:MAG: hypothetical protein M1536_01360 [Firmicutes bacterium]|nr:hypothetical protein [Bacillota bacterium]